MFFFLFLFFVFFFFHFLWQSNPSHANHYLPQFFNDAHAYEFHDFVSLLDRSDGARVGGETPTAAAAPSRPRRCDTADDCGAGWLCTDNHCVMDREL
jgi:hypothetical protein